MEPILHEFYARLKAGRVFGRKCRACDVVSFPPRGLCPGCGAREADWLELTGEGVLLFASCGPNLLLGKAYIMATVALREGPVVSGPLLEDFDFAQPQAIWDYNGIYMPVRIEIAAHQHGGPLVAFRRRPNGSSSRK